MADKQIIPTGGDDTSMIAALIKPGAVLDFSPSIFRVDGTLTLVDDMTWSAAGATFNGKSNMITGNVKNITMTGGLYNGDKTTTGRLIEFVATNSKFSDMIIQNTGHTFGITMGSSGNAMTNMQALNSLNGLADRGENNKWTDCLCKGNSSDAFIIKCKNSIFTRCIIDGGAAGFGFYARIDQSNDEGAEISGNKFYDCIARNAAHAGFSLNCPSNGKNANIHDNYIQAICYNNLGGGLVFRNKSKGGKNQNNTFDVLCYNNQGAGVYIEGACNNNSGSCLVYGNDTDIDLDNKSTGNNIKVYTPKDKAEPKMKKGKNTVTEIPFDCQNKPVNIYCVNKYCGDVPIPPPDGDLKKVLQDVDKLLTQAQDIITAVLK